MGAYAGESGRSMKGNRQVVIGMNLIVRTQMSGASQLEWLLGS
jgi:hypothetical protein